MQIPDLKVRICPTAEYDQSTLDAVDGLVLSPGPGLPDDHPQLAHAIEEAIKRIPIFGVCLGLQAIVEHFGGQLYRLSQVMHGIQSKITITDGDGLWKGISVAGSVGRYHSYMAEIKSLPDPFIISSLDKEGRIMSLRHKNLPVFGVQFHPESYMTGQGLLIAENFYRFL